MQFYQHKSCNQVMQMNQNEACKLINTKHANTLVLLYFNQKKTCKVIKTNHANPPDTSLLQSKSKMQTYQNMTL